MRNRTSLRLGLAVAGIALLCWIPSAATEEKTPPKTTLERAEREMLRLRTQISNAGFRMEKNLQGVGVGAAGTNESATPARLCCSKNLRKMKSASEELKKIAGKLAACYEENGDQDGAMIVPLVMADLSTVDQTVSAYADAPTKQEAHGAMGALTQAFLQLRDDMDKLAACPKPPPEKIGGKGATAASP